MVTDEQVRRMRRKRMEGKRQEAAAAAAGMSVRSARRWEKGALPSELERVRWWRTRVDPFAELWEQELVPLLRADREGVLEAKTLLAELEARYPGATRRVSCGRCSGGCGRGGPCTGRPGRSTFRRSIRRGARRWWTSRTRASWG